MQTAQAAVMGLFQGLTEFLPVSSSGHIVLSSALFKLFAGSNFEFVAKEEVFFEILVHLATLFAVLIYFFKDIKQILTGFFKALLTHKFNSYEFRFGIYILFATAATCILGFFIKDFAHKLTQSPCKVSLLLMVTGLVLFLSEKFKSKNKTMNLKIAVLIGLAQGLAVLPGISRSAMTICIAMIFGINKFNAGKFSFILSIPIIILASCVYPIISFDFNEIKNFNVAAIIFGMFISFISGYFCIKYFMNFLKKGSLVSFAYYCFIIGAVCLIIFTNI